MADHWDMCRRDVVKCLDEAGKLVKFGEFSGDKLPHTEEVQRAFLGAAECLINAGLMVVQACNAAYDLPIEGAADGSEAIED